MATTGRELQRRGTGLGARLALATGALVLLVSASIGLAAVGSLRVLAEDQALARVRLAGATAAQEIRLAGEEVLTGARLLAERPTLARLLATEDNAAMESFLWQYCATSGHDGCAVMVNGEVFAASTGELPWGVLVQPQEGSELPDLALMTVPGELVHVGRAHVPERPGVAAIVVRRLGEAFAERIAVSVGLPVRIRPLADEERAGGATFAATPGRGEAASMPRVGRTPDGEAFRASYDLQSASGGRVAVVETDLAATTIRASLRSVAASMLAFVTLAAAVAVLLGVVLGRALARPLTTLTSAAGRIGRGDLATPVPATSGKEAAALSAAMEDMRRRLRDLTAELRRREHEAQALLGGIEEGVFAVDSSRRITYVNPQGAALLGVAGEEILGRFCGDVLDPAPMDSGRPCDEDCPIVHGRSRGGSAATEHLRLRDGSRRTVVITSSAPSEGRQVQVFRPETGLEGARRTRDAILANISHEFRTPLAAQLASIELLRDQIEAIDPEGAGELMGAMERGTLRLTRLVDNLLESVRVEAGELAIRRQRIAVDALIRDATAMVGPLIEHRGQRLTVHVAEHLPDLEGDATRLGQVLVNLLANASKFGPVGSLIGIDAVMLPQAVQIGVEDEGPGLVGTDEDSLFDRFYRAAGTEPDAAGMGLGLWIVKSIVERHGGSVSAVSRNTTGSRFVVTLPLPASDPESR